MEMNPLDEMSDSQNLGKTSPIWYPDFFLDAGHEILTCTETSPIDDLEWRSGTDDIGADALVKDDERIWKLVGQCQPVPSNMPRLQRMRR